MKNLLLLISLLWAFSAPIAAQNSAPPVTLEAVFLEFAFDGNLEAVQKLVSAGTPVDSTNAEMSTALMWAAFNGHNEVVAYLLEMGATVDAKDNNGRSALLYASSGAFPETVGLLLRKGAEVNIQGATEGFTALMMAAAEGHVDVVRVLLLNGASADIIDRDGDTAEKFARENGHSAVLQLLENPPVKETPPDKG